MQNEPVGVKTNKTEVMDREVEKLKDDQLVLEWSCGTSIEIIN